MRLGICDDEKTICGWISERARGLCPDAKVAVYRSGEELLADAERLDLLFLDIQMSGRNGIETAKELRRRKERTIIIFITALEEYVFQAFDVGAFHYLVKPFAEDKFDAVFKTALQQYREQADMPVKEERYFMIQRGGVHTRVRLDEIIYAEVFNRKVVIHKADGEAEYYGKLSDLEKLAGEDFFRTHRAYLVNLKYVLQYNAGTIYLENGGKALVAKQKFPEFVKSYLKYNRSHY